MRDRLQPTILTIDGNQSVLGTLALLLGRMYFDVLPVTGCGDALDLARVARPQVITLNMQMPDMDSFAFLRALRAEDALADTPVIMFADVREKQRVWEAMSLGCIEVLDFPLDLQRLHQALQRCNLYPEGRRRYLRAPYSRRVELAVHGEVLQFTAVTLSERGIMVRMPAPLAKGTVVDVRFPLPSGEVLTLSGEVIYVLSDKGTAASPSVGVAIIFDRITIEETEKLQVMIRELLVGDIIANQAEAIIKSN